MANTIAFGIIACEPAPANGYRVGYRPLGSSEPFRIWPENFTALPPPQVTAIVFTDPSDPDGTPFEGFVQGDCGTGFGVEMPWEFGGGSGASGSGGGSDVEDCDGEGTVVVTNHLAAGTVTAVDGITGFSPLTSPILNGNSRAGTHTAFTGVVSFTVSGSSPSGNAILFKNDVVIGCHNINSAGLYAYPSTTFETCDVILIVMTAGDCL